jgi:hypothetical protein
MQDRATGRVLSDNLDLPSVERLSTIRIRSHEETGAITFAAWRSC